MESNKKLQVLGRGALLLSTLIWGTSFVILKNTLDYVPTLYVLAFRFCGAALLLCLISIRELKKIDKGYLVAGLVMGVTLLVAYIVQTYGLALTTPGKNAFLTSSYCVIAPLLGWAIYKKKPDRYNAVASIVCIIGIGFICLERDLSVSTGDLLTLLCGVFYAMQILVIEKYAAGRSVILLTMLQFAVAGVLTAGLAFVTTPVPTHVPGEAIFSMVYLCVMCSAVCYVLQIFGQKHTTAAATAVIMTLESVFGALFSGIFYHERFSAKLIVGFVLVFVAVLISETKLSFLHRQKSED